MDPTIWNSQSGWGDRHGNRQEQYWVTMEVGVVAGPPVESSLKDGESRLELSPGHPKVTSTGHYPLEKQCLVIALSHCWSSAKTQCEEQK